jgi:hypothetical protein
MNLAAKIREELDEQWIPQIYREKIRIGRTRSYHLDVPERENRVEIMFTLLGIEIKIGNKRFACPDLATARYLQVFARLGCRDFAVPYDITQISPIADELETAWQRLLLLLERETADAAPRGKARAKTALVREIRQEIVKIGPGDVMPEFKKSTKQRV